MSVESKFDPSSPLTYHENLPIDDDIPPPERKCCTQRLWSVLTGTVSFAVSASCVALKYLTSWGKKPVGSTSLALASGAALQASAELLLPPKAREHWYVIRNWSFEIFEAGTALYFLMAPNLFDKPGAQEAILMCMLAHGAALKVISAASVIRKWRKAKQEVRDTALHVKLVESDASKKNSRVYRIRRNTPETLLIYQVVKCGIAGLCIVTGDQREIAFLASIGWGICGHILGTTVQQVFHAFMMEAEENYQKQLSKDNRAEPPNSLVMGRLSGDFLSVTVRNFYGICYGLANFNSRASQIGAHFVLGTLLGGAESSAEFDPNLPATEEVKEDDLQPRGLIDAAKNLWLEIEAQNTAQRVAFVAKSALILGSNAFFLYSVAQGNVKAATLTFGAELGALVIYKGAQAAVDANSQKKDAAILDLIVRVTGVGTGYFLTYSLLNGNYDIGAWTAYAGGQALTVYQGGKYITKEWKREDKETAGKVFAVAKGAFIILAHGFIFFSLGSQNFIRAACGLGIEAGTVGLYQLGKYTLNGVFDPEKATWKKVLRVVEGLGIVGASAALVTFLFQGNSSAASITAAAGGAGAALFHLGKYAVKAWPTEPGFAKRLAVVGKTTFGTGITTYLTFAFLTNNTRQLSTDLPVKLAIVAFTASGVAFYNLAKYVCDQHIKENLDEYAVIYRRIKTPDLPAVIYIVGMEGIRIGSRALNRATLVQSIEEMGEWILLALNVAVNQVRRERGMLNADSMQVFPITDALISQLTTAEYLNA